MTFMTVLGLTLAVAGTALAVAVIVTMVVTTPRPEQPLVDSENEW